MRKVLPNLITTMNLALGMVALVIAFDGQYPVAAIVVMVGMALDGLDGRVARALGAQSEFGRELDSLSDLVTFGVAPAVIMYIAALRDLGLTGDLIAILFPIAGALRLARFNTQTGRTQYFVGLPITAAGGILSAFALYHGLIPAFWLPILTVALSYLMVSKTRYPNFKRVGLPKRASTVIPLLAICVAVLFVRHRYLVPGLVFAVLALYGGYGVWYDIRAFLRRRAKARERLRRAESK